MNKILLLFGFVFLQSCTYKKIEIDISEYSKIEEIDYSEIKPYKKFDCWGIIENGLFSDSILFTSNACIIDKSVFDYERIIGIDWGCAPVLCNRYIITLDQTDTLFWSDADRFRQFLGTIDNISEALLLARAYQYKSKESSVYKQDDEDFLLVLYKLVDNSPLQTDRFLLRINKNGTMKILGREIYKKTEGVII